MNNTSSYSRKKTKKYDRKIVDGIVNENILD